MESFSSSLPPDASASAIERQLQQAVNQSQPAIGDLFPMYDRDEDNPDGNGQMLFENGELIDYPDSLSAAQLDTVRLVTKFIPPQGQIRLTQSQVAKILHDFRMRTACNGMGMTSIPMACSGPYCPLVQDKKAIATGGAERDLSKCRCSLYEAGAHPLGKSCPLEVLQDSALRRSLYSALGVDDDHVVHAHVVGNLVAWIVIQSRILAEMGSDPFMTVNQETQGIVLGGGRSGVPATIEKLHRKEISPLLIAMDLCQKHIDALRKQLIATPEMVKRLNPREDEDETVHVSRTLNRRQLIETSTIDLDAIEDGSV